MWKTYNTMRRLRTFEERFDYLKLQGLVGAETFGRNRYLNQAFYQSPKWKKTRREVIIRDNGCDLGVDEYEILDEIIVHHLNPITEEDLLCDTPALYDLNNLVCVSHSTHNALHYGDASLIPKLPVERTPNDTCPWKKLKTEGENNG